MAGPHAEPRITHEPTAIRVVVLVSNQDFTALRIPKQHVGFPDWQDHALKQHAFSKLDFDFFASCLGNVGALNAVGPAKRFELPFADDFIYKGERKQEDETDQTDRNTPWRLGDYVAKLLRHPDAHRQPDNHSAKKQ